MPLETGRDDRHVGITLQEIAEALHAALVQMFGYAADQFKAINDAMNAMARGEELEPMTPNVAEKAPRPHPCPDAGHQRRPENVRLPQSIQRARIRPQARSTIKQRRNRRRE